MAVSERLMARVFDLNEHFVEVRFFHSPYCALHTSLLFGLFETAVKPQYTQSMGQKLRNLNWSETKSIVQYLMSPEVPIAQKQALWGEENVVFWLMSAIHGADEDIPDDNQLKSDITRNFGLQIKDYSEETVPSEDSPVLYIGNVKGKVALLYPEYSSDSFSQCNCGYLYYHFGVYAKYQAQANGWAVSLPQIQSYPISCLNCKTDVGYNHLVQIAKKPTYRGVEILREIQNGNPLGGYKSRSTCLVCAGRLETMPRERICSCRQICWNCMVIYSLKKPQFECPSCRINVSDSTTWNKLNNIRGKIVGLERLTELTPPKSLEVHRSPPQPSLCAQCHEDAGSRLKRPCGCVLSSVCTEISTETCPACRTGEVRVEEVKSTKPFCPCGKAIEGKGIYCEQRCVCAACLFRHCLETHSFQCPTCHQDTFGIVALDVVCSWCCRRLLPADTDIAKHPCALCTCGAILCCFCIKLDSDSPVCPLPCKGALELLDPKLEIQEKQTSFPYACYCGKPAIATASTPCRHLVHQDCTNDIFSCRKCGTSLKPRPNAKLLGDYLD